MAGSTSSSTVSLTSYKIKLSDSSDFTIEVGDNVLVRPSSGSKPWIAKVNKILSDKTEKSVTLIGQWYYRPENTKHGRMDFHGSAELFMSNHYDNIWIESIDGKCKVHEIKEYQRLEVVGPTDYYYRLKYDVVTDSYQPEKLQVYCSCEKPYNPDLKMIQCERCYEWYHIKCIGLTEEEVESIGDYICDPCKNT
uniref:Uncharacterized protein n=1 Tax=Kalanchoe fedtschenkoi TaxID=63787 RepID=A0A7N0TVC5_KALFE